MGKNTDAGTQKQILIVTSGQPSLNPRLIKEADALSAAGYDVRVLYQYWNEWASENDVMLLKTKKWKAERVGGHPALEQVRYHATRVQHKIFRILSNQLGFESAGDYAVSRSSLQLAGKAKSIKADMYIGHNLGALPAVVMAARYHNAICGFDAEDYHRFETSDDPADPQVKMKIRLEEKYFPQLDFLITSSPLITRAYQKHFPSKSISTIINAFGYEPGAPEKRPGTDTTLRLFWFSQTAGRGRGLEDVFKALDILSHPDIELHLLGDISNEYRSELLSLLTSSTALKDRIHFHDPVEPGRIIPFAMQFDIGLAIETGKPYNREICLTNKIFSYIQSGLAVIASDTQAQKELMHEYQGFGTLYQKGNVAQIVSVIKKYYSDRRLLEKHQEVSKQLAQNQLNWDHISQQLVSVIDSHFR